MKKLKENMATKEDINKMIIAIDKVIQQYTEVKIEQTFNLAAHDHFEARITKVEEWLSVKE